MQTSVPRDRFLLCGRFIQIDCGVGIYSPDACPHEFFRDPRDNSIILSEELRGREGTFRRLHEHASDALDADLALAVWMACAERTNQRRTLRLRSPLNGSFSSYECPGPAPGQSALLVLPCRLLHGLGECFPNPAPISTNRVSVSGALSAAQCITCRCSASGYVGQSPQPTRHTACSISPSTKGWHALIPSFRLSLVNWPPHESHLCHCQ